MTSTKWVRAVVLCVLGLLFATGGVALVAVWTAPTRGAVRTFTRLLAAANSSDVVAAQVLCTARYNASHTLKPAYDGGIVGLPRNIHKNFKVWKEGNEVLLCPTNRTGPVYRFIDEAGDWRFDGPVGHLMSGNVLVRLEDTGAAELSGDEGSPD